MCNLPVQKRQSALGGCLHVESTIDSYGDRQIRPASGRGASVRTHLTARHVVDSPAELGPSTWALSGAQARLGFVCWTKREIG